MAFRLGSSTRLDERCFAMQQFKVMPLSLVMLCIYPKMYPIHELSDEVSPELQILVNSTSVTKVVRPLETSYCLATL